MENEAEGESCCSSILHPDAARHQMPDYLVWQEFEQ
jgi:hypothetical protein